MATTLPTRTSDFPFDETIDRLVAQIEREGWHLFTRIDHAELAHKQRLELRPTVVLLLGNPEVGTHLMQDRQVAAIDLPTKILVWQDADGAVYVTHHDLAALQAEHALRDTATLAVVGGVVERVCAAATRA
ncbi:MAG TPA: DUF302 domain-containing protein [Rhodanobacteraceae bacterium]|nr:DUF302 domain-containing protein [Rhodanobacteraceae bacterium]